jgi:hypothetical protein
MQGLQGAVDRGARLLQAAADVGDARFAVRGQVLQNGKP